MMRLEQLGSEGTGNGGARLLRARFMATLLSTGLIAACGGNVADDEASGGAAGSAGSTSNGGSMSQGGSGAVGGSGSVGGSSSVGGSVNTGGSGSVGGSSFGGSVNSGGSGSVGGSSAGSSSVGGSSAVGGASTGGAGGAPDFRIEGEVVCDFCGTWTTCFAASDTPGGLDAELDPNGCPYWLDSSRTPPMCDGGFIDYWPLEEQRPGECCYNSMYQCGGGRPFLVAGAPRVAAVATRQDWQASFACSSSAAPSSLQAARLAAGWLEDALMEHASVAAFARFSLELLGFGAPADLVRDSQLAALDEIRHAEACFALASRFGGEAVGPGALELDDAMARRSLEDFARCTFVEGCIGETFATLVAQTGAARAVDQPTRQVLGGIAEDEARHAELAWRSLGWVMAQLSEARRRDLALSLEAQLQFEAKATRAELASLKGSDADLSAFGRVGSRRSLQLRLEALEQVVAPCLASLVSGAELRAA